MTRHREINQKKRRPENMQTKIKKKQRKHMPRKLDFHVHSHTELSFPLFTICSDYLKNDTQRPSKLRPASAFVIQNMAGERSKQHTNNNHQKSQEIYVKKVVKKSVQKNSLFYLARKSEFQRHFESF